MSVHHERIINSMLRSLETGCPVVTADGEQIGTLSEIAEEAIKVDAPLRRDFWIEADYVRSCENDRVELSFRKQDLGAYKMDQPSSSTSAPDATPTDFAVDNAERRVDLTRRTGMAYPDVATSEESVVGRKPATDPLVQGKADHIISEEEQIETRLRMERELAAQRQDLPHLHPRGEEGPPDTFGTLGEPVESELSRYGIEPAVGSTESGTFAPAQGGFPFGRFIAIAAAVSTVAAAAWWMRRRR
jgi:hypothetical protein